MYGRVEKHHTLAGPDLQGITVRIAPALRPDDLLDIRAESAPFTTHWCYPRGNVSVLRRADRRCVRAEGIEPPTAGV